MVQLTYISLHLFDMFSYHLENPHYKVCGSAEFLCREKKAWHGKLQPVKMSVQCWDISVPASLFMNHHILNLIVVFS